MICSHCQKAITPGQPHRSFDKFSTSAGGSTAHYHLTCLLKKLKP